MLALLPVKKGISMALLHFFHILYCHYLPVHAYGYYTATIHCFQKMLPVNQTKIRSFY